MHEDHSVVNLRDVKKAPEPPPPPPSAPRPHVPPKPKFTYSKPLVLALVLLIVVPLGIGLYLHPPFSSHKEGVVPTTAEEGSGQVTDVVAKVGALIELPQDETPTVATVTDPSKLKDQAFFTKAQTGDQVLIYTKARKAYLFDPTHNKLREVAPITTQ